MPREKGKTTRTVSEPSDWYRNLSKTHGYGLIILKNFCQLWGLILHIKEPCNGSYSHYNCP